MQVILILLGAIVGVGAVLYLLHRLTPSDDQEKKVGENDVARTQHGDAQREETGDGEGSVAGGVEETVPTADSDAGECCGLHVVCQRSSLLAGITEQPEYYDDEELDRFRGREADAYSDAEADEFRDVMLTMAVDDIAGWARSLKLRGVELPRAVREELIMIVAERRDQS